MKIKLKDIAETLKLSPATVSRALRNHPLISEETRTLVLREAERLGYQVSYTHRGRKLHSENGDFHLLALVSGGSSNDSSLQNASGLTHETLKGISDVADYFNARLIIDFVDPKRMTIAEMQKKCAGFDGIIFIHRFEEKQVRAIAGKKPCVSADYAYPSAMADVVSGGDIDQFVALAGYLKKNGHTRIGYVDFPGPSHPRGFRGYCGFLSGLRQAGLSVNPELHLRNQDFPDEQMKINRAAELTHAGKADVWVCANDYAAMELLEKFTADGLSVPDDISITGFGGIQFPGTNLQLCSFRTPFEQIGQEAAKYLFDRIRTPGIPVRHAFIDCTFIEGNSVRCLN